MLALPPLTALPRWRAKVIRVVLVHEGGHDAEQGAAWDDQVDDDGEGRTTAAGREEQQREIINLK